MEASAATATPFKARPKLADRLGDPLVRLLTFLSAVVGVGSLVWMGYTVFDQASAAISRYGLGFLGSATWNPVANQFGAANFIYGTIVSSFLALLIAGPMSVAIALFLT